MWPEPEALHTEAKPPLPSSLATWLLLLAQPLHDCVLQLRVSVDEPEHCLPPFCGRGLVHERVRFCEPPPQALEQPLNAVHADEPPWTGQPFVLQLQYAYGHFLPFNIGLYQAATILNTLLQCRGEVPSFG